MNDLEWRLSVCREAVYRHPGHMIDWYAPSLAVKLGVTEKKIHEYFKRLVDAKEIVERNGRFYPPGYFREDRKEDEEKEKLLQYLGEKAGEAERGEDVKYLTGEKTIEWQELIKHEAKPDMENYILVYDIKISKDTDSAELRRIYRQLEKTYHQILKEGRWAERIQKSVWKFESREDALRMASILESMAKVRVFRVQEEV